MKLAWKFTALFAVLVLMHLTMPNYPRQNNVTGYKCIPNDLQFADLSDYTWPKSIDSTWYPKWSCTVQLQAILKTGTYHSIQCKRNIKRRKIIRKRFSSDSAHDLKENKEGTKWRCFWTGTYLTSFRGNKKSIPIEPIFTSFESWKKLNLTTKFFLWRIKISHVDMNRTTSYYPNLH